MPRIETSENARPFFPFGEKHVRRSHWSAEEGANSWACWDRAIEIYVSDNTHFCLTSQRLTLHLPLKDDRNSLPSESVPGGLGATPIKIWVETVFPWGSSPKPLRIVSREFVLAWTRPPGSLAWRCNSSIGWIRRDSGEKGLAYIELLSATAIRLSSFNS
jgi:hypothetical protein